jgi:acyl-CoA reductase-like NAD-dependent aldehyde dehydrogenase
MATKEELERKVQALKENLKKKIEQSPDPEVDRIVRMARKKLKRAQRRLRLIKAREQKAAEASSRG